MQPGESLKATASRNDHKWFARNLYSVPTDTKTFRKKQQTLVSCGWQDQLFQSLRDAGQSDGECLHGAEGRSEVERVGAVLNPTELHHLSNETITPCQKQLGSSQHLSLNGKSGETQPPLTLQYSKTAIV
jgi:hypothetical protein